MDHIPQDLVKSLMELGLLESEAKIYVSLVIMNNSEVKELIDFVGISKPNTYEGLRSLEEKGLINLINGKPITYQAVSPDIGLEILFDTHVKAKDHAKKLFATLDKTVNNEGLSDSLWYVFTKKNVEYKLRDMVKNANKSVQLLSSDHFVKYLKPLARKDLDMDITIISGSGDKTQSLKTLFNSDKANITIVDKKNLVRMLAIYKSANQEEYISPFENFLSMFNFENMLILIVDDTELLYVLPLSDNSMNAINSKNKAMVKNMKLVFSAMSAYLVSKNPGTGKSPILTFLCFGAFRISKKCLSLIA